MKYIRTNTVKKFNTCAMLASITVLFQISMAVLPGIGHILSAAGVLPIALMAIVSPRTALMGAAVSAWLTFMILPHELPLFISCTAPLGLVLGFSMHFSLKKPVGVLIGTGVLTAGMLILTLFLGLPAFGPLLAGKSFFIAVLFYLGFSFAYSYAWSGFISKMRKRLKHSHML